MRRSTFIGSCPAVGYPCALCGIRIRSEGFPPPLCGPVYTTHKLRLGGCISASMVPKLAFQSLFFTTTAIASDAFAQFSFLCLPSRLRQWAGTRKSQSWERGWRDWEVRKEPCLVYANFLVRNVSRNVRRLHIQVGLLTWLLTRSGLLQLTLSKIFLLSCKFSTETNRKLPTISENSLPTKTPPRESRGFQLHSQSPRLFTAKKAEGYLLSGTHVKLEDSLFHSSAELARAVKTDHIWRPITSRALFVHALQPAAIDIDKSISILLSQRRLFEDKEIAS